MKISNPCEIYTLIQELGIHPNPFSLSKAELESMVKDPALKAKILQAMTGSNRNYYQELEMDSLYVNTHRDVSYEPESLQLHSHSFFEIIYCESGHIQYLIADKRYQIHAGDVILVPPGVSHRPLFYNEMTEPYSRIVLWVSTDYISKLASLCPDNILLQLRSKDHYLLRLEGTSFKYLESYFKKGLQESESASPMWDIALYGNTATLLAHLSRILISMPASLPAEKEEHIDQIISHIEKNYAQKITLESVAEAFHISTSTLGKLFQNKMGVSFYHYVTQRRLINSKIQIEEGNSMEEVALDCGFCDYSAFYRAFKKEYGISPREYKKMFTSSDILLRNQPPSKMETDHHLLGRP